ncbi:MAG: hypothetical protein HY264_09570 [Chloroflexi bacterium]|nr:hypothetical protein [Chloroflexota bacterium]
MTQPEKPDQGRPETESSTARDVLYKGAPLDSEKGPGLGCFWAQVVLLAVLLALTPLSVAWAWPTSLSAVLLVAVLVLLLFAGQTVIFLLRLVAADRRAAGRRRPLASRTPTVGEIEERAATPGAGSPKAASTAPPPAEPDPSSGGGGDGVRE